MKFTAERAAFLAALNTARGTVDTKGIIPIYSHFRLTLAGNSLTITASNGDAKAEATVTVDGSVDGSCTAPAVSLVEIIKRLDKDATVTLSLAGEELTVKAGRSRFKLQSMPVEEFFDAFGKAAPAMSAVPAADLAKSFNAVRFAASTEETRYYLNGVFVEPDGGQANFVSTDGHRLAIQVLEADLLGPAVIIPSAAVSEIVKLCDGVDMIRIGWTDTVVVAETDKGRYASKLIDGTFPDYRRVIPQANESRLECSASALGRAVALVTAVAEDKARTVQLDLSAGLLALSSIYGNSTAEDELEVSFDGAPMKIGFNGKYLGELMAAVPGDEVAFALGGATDPALVTVGGGEGWTGILMPVRL